MKLGIIGSGLIVQEFLPRLIGLDGMEVLAIQGAPGSKQQIEKLCEENNIPHALIDFEELCQLEIDTVYVAVPNFLHFDYCKKALEKGLNVIVEKPMTSNATEAKILKQIAMEKECFLFEAVTTLYFAGYQKIKEWLPEIGTVKLVKCNYSQYSRRYDAFRNGEVLPAFDPNKSGGALMDLNLYNLHFVMGLFGKPEEVKYYANIERGIDTSGTLILNYEGFIAECTAAKDCSAPYSFVIQGTNGYIKTAFPPNLIGKITLHKNDGSEKEYDDGMFMNRLIPEFNYFISCIERNDLEACLKKLDESITVSEIQTEARLNAGIIFPADQQIF
ncbi:MAG: Gfo/Idh/MocA family oxidoreductase [Erysipelotrichaceae bacterium]|nr:Gfo/Idh/MocA family oxidoreductase [Erysipelotrichaceae bacterium]